MPDSNRSLIGTLTSSTAKLGGLRVEAWDAQGNCPDLIDLARTDARGHFTMQLDADYISELLPQRQPAISFRIFDNGKLVPQTPQVTWQVTQQSTQLTIPIGAASVATVAVVTPAPSVVRGTIRSGDGSPASNRMVRAFDRNLASPGFNDTPLGQTSTAADGQYEIHYLMPAGAKLKPDLIVRVDAPAAATMAPAAKAAATMTAPGITVTPVRTPIATTVTGVTPPPSGTGSAATPGTVAPPIVAAPAAESSLLPQAPTVAMVDLSLDNITAALLSEHRTLLAPVSNAISAAKLQLADLTGDQFDYVADVTGLQSDRLQTMVQAAQLSRETGGAVDAEVFYGLLCTGHEGDLAALATAPVDVQRARLEVAIEQNFISATYEPDIDNIVTALQNTIVSHAMPATGASTVSAALANSLAGTDVQTSFVSRWVGRTGPAQQFWEDLRADETLGAHADDLETTLRLDMLFDGFQPALADLRAQRQSNKISSLRDLARWQDSDWQSFLTRVGTPPSVAGDTPADKVTNYLTTQAPQARAAFPTEYLRGRAAVAPPPLGTKFLPTLAAANPTLDLTRPLPDSPNWGTISANDQPAALAEWSAFQREARTFSQTPARTLLDSVVKAGGSNSIRATANKFLTSSTVDLEQTTVDQYLAANPTALSDIAVTDRPTVVSYLKGMQRVLRLVAKPEAVETLLGDGLNSALRIARLSRAEFVDRYTDLLGGEAAAQDAYSTAFRTAATAQLALTTTAQSMAGVSPWALRGGSTSKFAIPDYGSVLDLLKNTAGASNNAATWPNLFQNEAWCDCEECQSIYGPAAYFVDLLHMLDPDGSERAPVDHLFDRRPDLPNLLLTCDNTNTPLPYIDVVNEILELYVAQSYGYTIPGTNPPVPYATSTSYDNTGISADELRAAPQNLIAQVYDSALANEVYPFTLPFQRSLAVMRTYLDQLGTSYYDLLVAFAPDDGAAGLSAAERLAAEALGLTTLQFKLIAGLPAPPDQPTSLAGCYGYVANDSNWQDTLSAVSELLLHTGITYDDLYGLIGDQSQAGTYFLNRNGAVTLDPPIQGQIDGTHIHVAPDTYDRLHRFIRLWRATTWSIADLDRVLFAVGAQSDHSVTLDRDVLRRVTLVKQVVDQLEQPLAAVLTLWSDLDTWGTDSLYLSLFQSRSVTRLDDATLFKLAGNPSSKPVNGSDELAVSNTNPNEKMSDHVATILAALRISAADLAAIWSHAVEAGAFGGVSSHDDIKLNLHNLTVVYRYVVLARGIALRITDLVQLLELTGDNPFAPGDPAPTLAFIERAAMIQASGCTVATLAYVYRCYSPPGQGPAPADSMVLDALSKIWAALCQVHQDTAMTDDPDGTLLTSRLALIQPPEVVKSILDALDPTKGMSATARTQALSDGLQPSLGAEFAKVETQVLGTPDPTDPVALAARGLANQSVVLSLISTALRTSLSQSAVVSVVAESLNLLDTMTRRLLTEWIPGDNGTALDTLLELGGGGLNVELFDGPGFTTPEPSGQVASPVSMQVTVGSQPCGARWTGYLLPLGDGLHTFILRSDGNCSIKVGESDVTTFQPQLDDGRSLMVDNTLPPVTLTANQLVRIEISYDSGTAPGSFSLLWKLASATTTAPIASEYLFPVLTALLQDGAGPGYAWKRAHKASLLIGGLGLAENEIAYAESSDQPFGQFHLRDLPMQAPADDAVHQAMARWQELAAFVAWRSSLPTTDVTLVDVLQTTPPANIPDLAGWWTQNLSAATAWDPAAVGPLLSTMSQWSGSSATILAQLLQAVGGPLLTNGALELGRRLTALQQCLTLVKRIGVAGDAPDGARPTLRVWAASEPDSAAAREVIQAVRAGYTDDAQWYQIAQTRNDPLRQLQRDALVAHIMPRLLIDNVPLTDTDELYEHFLIDVEMCACSQTSRVLQGISTVQLFIQRILLGLETGISPSRIDPDKWEWNQNYRVWEANREIFLYPENWIDPELRVDETPFFADLQAQLSQGPLEADNVENAFEAYLLQLEQVSRLKVCALHWQREGKADASDSELAADHVIDSLHVIARTPGAHATYYYRTLLGVAAGTGGTEWTPWQKVDVDIQSDGDTGDVHMLLTTYDRRLYFFWLLFTEVPEPSQPGANQGESPPPPLTHWEIRLAWSTCRNGVWSPKQVSSGSVRSERFITSSDLGSYKSALDETKARIKQDRKRYEDAVSAANKAATEWWNEMQQLGQQFYSILTQCQTDTGEPSDDATIKSINLHCRAFNCTSTEGFEAWIKSNKLTVDQFISDIFRFVAHLPEGFLTFDHKALSDDYQGVLDSRTKRDDLQSQLDKIEKSLQDFMQGRTDMAVPSLTTRADHTFWLDTSDDTVTIDVLRHDGRNNPRKLGSFSLSDDGRSVSTSNPKKSTRPDISRQLPRHSKPNINSFVVDTTTRKGLDLEGLPNLLGRVNDASFIDEHWFYHPATSESLRPFTVAKGSDLNLALPVKAQTDIVTKPTYGAGVDISQPGQLLPLNGAVNPLPKAPVDSNKAQATPSIGTDGELTAGHDTFDENLGLIRSQKSFGLDGLDFQSSSQKGSSPSYCFEPLDHPFVRNLIARLERDGVDGLLTTAAQNPAGDDQGETGAYFDNAFNPSPRFVAAPYPPYDVDFRPQGAYSEYNWELFFHAPYLIASRLMQDARYDDARSWLHYIFNPTTSSKEEVPARFWKLQPFRDNTDMLNASQLMTALATQEPASIANSVMAQIDQWNRYPADPHRIARLRTSAYQKAIVFKYLDNLVAWADSLFTQDTIESINQATQLYVFASHLLGPRPQHVPQKNPPPSLTYDQLRGHLDKMSDMVAEVETMLHPQVIKRPLCMPDSAASSLLGINHLPVTWQNGQTPDVSSAPLAFCVPPNTKLLTYFDTIDDRLFKIRHCMNIEGVVQQLPLFQPPIDPALLVRAAAMGLDISSILADLSAPLPFHRFAVMLQKALELCGELKSLGGQLLSALEKQDAEALALLRATHDTSVAQAVLEIKKQQVKEAETNKVALLKSRELTQAKYDYYASREFMNSWETQQISQMGSGIDQQKLGGVIMSQASSAFAYPDMETGPTGMGVHGTARFGGSTFGNLGRAAAEAINSGGQAAHGTATTSGILGGHHRRQDEWGFQTTLASKELAQIDQQLAAADIRIAIASLDVTNQQLQIDNARQIEDTLRTKYTNKELYSWMVTQISTTYYQAYKLAYDLAKRTERCYQYELGVTSSSFIQFGYWDSLRKGLLAGERLTLDLKRMDASYLQTNRREYEITRQISLVLQDPQSFIDLRRQGSCEFDLPEEFFDADYPGHYFRRIKSVGLTLPCVAGPYTPINCTLTLLSSHVRTSAVPGSKYPEENSPNDSRFNHNYGAIQGVATSHGQNDAGLFEVNFRDERYLPFEGAGAISRWRIELPPDCNAFDFDTLADVVMKLSYTARDGGKPLADAARKSLRARWNAVDQGDGVTPMTPLRRLFRIRYEFSDTWGQFRNALSAGDAAMTLTLDQTRFPFLFRGASLTITGAQLFATLTDGTKPTSLALTITPPGGEKKDSELAPATSTGATMLASALLDPPPAVDVTHNTDWMLAAKAGFPIATIRDLMLLVTYTAKMT